MREIVTVKSNELFPIVREIFDHNGTAKIRVTGMSMLPFLRHERDFVELSATGAKELHKGDIVLVVRDSSEYVLHRVIKISSAGIYINGDSQCWTEGPIRPGQLAAKVISIWRDNRQIKCDNLFWRLLSHVWLLLFPVRPILLRFYYHFTASGRKTINGDKVN